MTVADEILQSNETYAATFEPCASAIPRKHLAILTCMDARLDVNRALGLVAGDAHIIRNPGGMAGEPEIRALTVSQRLLETREIVVVQHTDCGMRRFADAELKGRIESEVGIRPQWPVEEFGEVDADVARSIERIRSSPFVPHTTNIRGFVFDVASGELREV